MSVFSMMDVAVLATLACSVGLNMVQTQKIRQLTAPPPAAPVVSNGMPVALVVKTSDGKDALLAPRQLPLVLYFFSESCDWCERNPESVNGLERQVRGRYRVAGVSL